MPLLKLWGLHGNKVNKIPRLTEIEAAQQLVNYQNIQIEGNRVRIENGQEINTGSFLKAYAISNFRETEERWHHRCDDQCRRKYHRWNK